MVTANSVKFSSVTYKIFPSNTGEPSRSTLKACFLGFDLDTIAGIRQYPLSFSLLERFEQPSTAQKFTIEQKLQDYLQLGPRTRRICFDACPPLRKMTCVTSLLKWVYTRMRNCQIPAHRHFVCACVGRNGMNIFVRHFVV